MITASTPTGPGFTFPEHLRPIATEPPRVVAAVNIPAGWRVENWAGRLRTVADACEQLHPDRATVLWGEAESLNMEAIT